jgi:hypothetical protein
MATVTYLGENYSCSVALKGANYIHLLDENGKMIAAFDGITNFSGFAISGGSWTVPASDDDCYLAVIREDGTIGKGGHKCSDVGSVGENPTFNVVTANKVIGAVYA